MKNYDLYTYTIDYSYLSAQPRKRRNKKQVNIKRVTARENWIYNTLLNN